MAVCVQIDFFKSFHSYSCTKETRGTKSETPTLYKKIKIPSKIIRSQKTLYES